MFFRKSNKKDGLIDMENRILADMETYGPEAPEFPTLLDQLERIRALRSVQKPKRISADTVVMVVGNVVVALIVVAFEQKHVITSKVQSFMQKPK